VVVNGKCEYILFNMITTPDLDSKMQSGSNMTKEVSRLRSKALPILDRMYKNIDIRAVLVKSRHDEWHSAFLKIYFTKYPKDNVQNAHKNKESFRTIIKNANLMLISE
jgi:aspartyl/asparaginyl beta-hydroxylase (cupin superfamily)